MKQPLMKQPLMTRKQKLWLKLLLTIFSPLFHWRIFQKRLASCFFSANTFSNLKAWFFVAVIGEFVNITNSWLTFLIVWVFPLTILYQISSTLRLCAEHTFPQGLKTSPTQRDYGNLTVGIFLGEPVPNISGISVNSLLQWGIWWLKIFFFHFLFCRVFIMVGDTPCHDYHHRYPSSKDWPNYIFSRQQDLNNSCTGWTENYREVFGLFPAIDLTFESLIQYKEISDTDFIQLSKCTQD